MVRTHEGLTFWYGTPDAPAPGDAGLVSREGTALVLGVQPINPSNVVNVRYRVDKGLVQTLSGRELRTDYERQIQYFAVAFPAFPTGQVVEYAPILTCGGRQVPAPAAADGFLSRFRLEEKPAAPPPAPAVARAAGRGQRFDPGLSYLADVAVTFYPPELVCDTADGVRINFFVSEGTVSGKGLSGKVLDGAADHLLVRRDGVALTRIRAAFALDDGAVIDIDSGGYVDFGPDAYRRALANNLPDRAPLVVTPLMSTRHPKYRWLSRIQCIGTGETHLAANQVGYQVHTVSPHRLP